MKRWRGLGRGCLIYRSRNVHAEPYFQCVALKGTAQLSKYKKLRDYHFFVLVLRITAARGRLEGSVPIKSRSSVSVGRNVLRRPKWTLLLVSSEYDDASWRRRI